MVALRVALSRRRRGFRAAAAARVTFSCLPKRK